MRSKVVGIVGSPRKWMNTDTLVSKVLEGSQSFGVEAEKIYLNDLEIKPCQACERNPEHALASINLWCKDANIELVDSLIVTKSDRGEGARNRKDLLQRAYELGVSPGKK